MLVLCKSAEDERDCPCVHNGFDKISDLFIWQLQTVANY